MTKQQILTLKNIHSSGYFPLYKPFELACEHIHSVRVSEVSPVAQCRIRAGDTAAPLTILWLGLVEMVEKMEKNNAQNY